MKIGDKVHARYTDAAGRSCHFDGTIVAAETAGWRVDIGGVAILFHETDLLTAEVKILGETNGKGT
jgi:hypothetical protein